MDVIICGGGVIGASIAYFLAQRGIRSTVVERYEVACAASGKSGGFIAQDWCDGQPQQQLARRSFALHQELAELFADQHGIDYGFRPVQTLSLASSERRNPGNHPSRHKPEWLSAQCVLGGLIGDESTTAQVHPRLFTQALMNIATSNGAMVRHGIVDGVLSSADGSRILGVTIDGEALHADAVVIAMGPWSGLFGESLGLPPIGGLKGYSVILRPTSPLPAQALFVDYECTDGSRPSPEIVPRADGDVWLCGMSGNDPLPVDPGAVSINEQACGELQRIAARLCPALDGAELIAAQACYRPICADAMPLIGAISGADGAFIASAHNCWGMLNAPATGLVMSELLVDGVAASVDITALCPSRGNIH